MPKAASVEDVGDVEKSEVDKTRSLRSSRDLTSARLRTEISSIPARVLGRDARVRLGIGFMSMRLGAIG